MKLTRILAALLALLMPVGTLAACGEAVNAGSRSMRLSEDTLLTSEGITMRCEPEVLPGGAEGDLVITYNASESANEQSLRLYIKGLTLPPRERLILLKVIK